MKIIVTKVGNGFIVRDERMKYEQLGADVIVVEGKDPRKLGSIIYNMIEGKKCKSVKLSPVPTAAKQKHSRSTSTKKDIAMNS